MARSTLAAVQSAVSESKSIEFRHYITFYDIVYHYNRCLAPLAENNRVLNAVVALDQLPFEDWPELSFPKRAWVEIAPAICGKNRVSRYSMALKELLRPGWSQLYSALGTVLIHILTEYTVFAESESLAVLQITGSQLVPSPRPTKRQKATSVRLSPLMLSAQSAKPESTDQPRAIFGPMGKQSQVAVISIMPLIYKAESRLQWLYTSSEKLTCSSRHLKQKIGLIYNHFAPPNSRKSMAPRRAGQFVYTVLQVIVSSEIYDSLQRENGPRLLESVCFPFAPLQLKTSAIRWLFPSSNKHAHQSQLCLAQSVSNWLISLAARLYSCFFHVTTAKQGNIVIFRRSVWHKIVSQQLNLFSARLNPANSVGVTCSKIKLIPKGKTSARVLILVKDVKNELDQIRQLLDGMLAQKVNELLPDCATLAPRLAEFACNHRPSPTMKPKFWLVKADISQCYDTIDLAKLRHALADWRNSLLLEQEFTVFNNSHGKLVKRALPSGGLETWQGLISERRKQPLMLTWDLTKSSLFQQIVCGEIDIGINYRTCHLKSGIPQGSKISMPLANLYLAALAEDCLASYLADPDCLLLRYVDDFLLVTTNEQRAHSFSEIFSNGFPEWNMSSNPKKAIVSAAELGFLGYFIDAKTLYVFPQFPSRARLKSINTTKMLVSAIYSPVKTLIIAFKRQNQQPPCAWIRELFRLYYLQIKGSAQQ